MCGMRLYISWPLKHSAVHLQERDPRYGVEMTADDDHDDQEMGPACVSPAWQGNAHLISMAPVSIIIQNNTNPIGT